MQMWQEQAIYIAPTEEFLGPMPRCKNCHTPTSIPIVSPTTAEGPEDLTFNLPDAEEKKKHEEKVESYSEEEALWRARINDQPKDPKTK
jgi:hypothetical protein